MINRYCLFFLFIATVLTGGCSGNADVSKSANAPSNPTAATASSNPGQNIGSNVMTDSPGAGRPVMRYELAPEDSQIAQSLNSSGQMYEVRIFKKNPQLLKIESVGIDQKNKALTIILRSGKVFNITTDRIPNVKLATANQFLDLAGVQPVAATPAAKSGPKKSD